MSNTSLGFLKPDGTAASWHANFVSESANMFVSIDTANGFLTCYANPGKAGRIPDLKPDFFRDGAALYALAKQHGEALLAQGYGVSLGTAAAINFICNGRVATSSFATMMQSAWTKGTHVSRT